VKLGAFFLIAIALLTATPNDRRKPDSGAKSPVIVELFTSEGCSSCPSADALLNQLIEAQPIPGVEIIALAQHVDYWNSINWSDPFSSASSSARQESYARVLKKEQIYTPQMVVDGQAELIGSNRQQAMTTIERAARGPKLAIELSPLKAARPEPGLLKLEARITDSPVLKSKDLLDVVFAITENGLASSVARGENSGRRLIHSAVVREMRLIGRAGDSASPFRREINALIPPAWNRKNLRAIVFVQERGRRRILGAAAIDLSD
jgi:hypothetical protein